jgi:penicillin-binding protein 2
MQRFVVDSVFAGKLVGGLMAMNPQNGEVLALHSGPSYDPNDFIGGISFAKLDSIRSDPRNILYSKVIKGKYAPASTFKLATAILALQHGLVDLSSRMPQPCHGSIMIGNRSFRCWKETGHGDITLAQAIESSCNVYFYQLGQRLGLARLMQGGVQLGFAGSSGIDLPGELPGTFPTSVDYLNRTYQGRGGWTEPSQVAFISIGQGAVDETVANVARFYSALATNGYAATPQLIRGMPPVRQQVYQLTPEQNQGVREALTNVVRTGTAVGSRRAEIVIAGKTGTAQNPHGEAHGWFVGFAPAENPTLLIAILIEHGLHGADAARQASRIFGFHFKQAVAPVVVTGG